MRKGELLNNFKHLDQADWSISNESQGVKVINNYTNDIFTYVKVELSASHPRDSYLARAAYRMPNTPQIIVGSPQRSPFPIEMLVQSSDEGLQKLLKPNICESVLKEIIKNLATTCQHLVSKFGFFQLTPQMIKVTNSFHPLIWIDENYAKMQPQFPFRCLSYSEGCKIILLNLLAIVEEAGGKKLMGNLRKRVEETSAMSFQKLKNYLEDSLKVNYKENKSERNLRDPPKFLLRSRSQKISPQKLFVNSLASSQFERSKSKGKMNLSKNQSSSLNTSNAQRKSDKGCTDERQQDMKGFQKYEIVKRMSQTSPPKLNGNKTQNYSLQKEKQFRQSNFSLKTTTGSIDSSGKFIRKVLQKNGQINLLNSDLSRLPYQSIVEDKNEQLTTPNVIKNDKLTKESTKFSDFQMEFHNLLMDKSLQSVRNSTTSITQLESQLNSLLLN